MFEYDFNGVTQQFKKTDYPPEGAPFNFLNLYKALDSLPKETFRLGDPFCIFVFISVSLDLNATSSYPFLHFPFNTFFY